MSENNRLADVDAGVYIIGNEVGEIRPPNKRLTIHPSITSARVTRAVRRNSTHDEFTGYCVACGRKAKQPCEPDAREYPCQFKSCGQNAVYGAEELLFHLVS